MTLPWIPHACSECKHAGWDHTGMVFSGRPELICEADPGEGLVTKYVHLRVRPPGWAAREISHLGFCPLRTDNTAELETDPVFMALPAEEQETVVLTTLRMKAKT